MSDNTTQDIKENLKQQSTWIRGLFMLLFAVFYTLAEILILFMVVFQFVLKLFSGEVNGRLVKFGQSLATYIYQITLFVTFNSETKPFPFGPWPKGEPPRKSKRVEKGTDSDGAAKNPA